MPPSHHHFATAGAPGAHAPADRGQEQAFAIVRLCSSIDRLASEIYATIAASYPPGDLKSFWLEMAEEEQSHVDLWNQIERQAHTDRALPVFDDPESTIASLERVVEKVSASCGKWESEQTASDPFVLACRLELSMLHPAFLNLFDHCWPVSATGRSFCDVYEAHLDRFVSGLLSHAGHKPELELLGETLQNLWRENKHLTQQAMHDELTGLLNRRGFWLLARQSAYYSQRTGAHLGVLMLDLDNFRTVNERYGHPKGDIVLKCVADALQQRLRKSDIVGRYGGEEFVVLCPSIERDALAQLAEALRQGVSRSQSHGIPVSVSIGAIEGAIHSLNPEAELSALIERADSCLYSAKRAGKNAIAFGDNQ